MNTLLYMKPEILVAWLFYQSMLQQQLMAVQQQLIETQQKVIALQQQIDDMRPKAISEKEEFWHLVSNGIMSDEAANSDDLRLVRKFRDWNMDFAKKHVKPYVNQQVYSEVVNQMTRGLSTRIAELETKSSKRSHEREREQANSNKTIKLKQTAFLS
jgi:hypothetical protein